MTTAYSSTFRTVDVAPAGVGSFTATGALRAATLTWKAPAVNDLDRYIVRMATGSTPPANVTAGTGVYSGTGASVEGQPHPGHDVQLPDLGQGPLGQVRPALVAQARRHRARRSASSVTSLT